MSNQSLARKHVAGIYVNRAPLARAHVQRMQETGARSASLIDPFDLFFIDADTDVSFRFNFRRRSTPCFRDMVSERVLQRVSAGSTLGIRSLFILPDYYILTTIY